MTERHCSKCWLSPTEQIPGSGKPKRKVINVYSEAEVELLRSRLDQRSRLRDLSA
jgi:hypothetical protein